ncbi:MAG: hypothetical protein WCA16_00210, partial [Candidatus Sulfotelmatobacter sp.]
MMDKLEGMKKQLSELATVLNQFKSEAVQLRILDLLIEEGSTDDPVDRPEGGETGPRRRRVPKTNAKAVGNRTLGKRKRASAGTGAPATLTQLLSGNFFDKARTINDVIEHCKHNLARTFRANEFSGKLGRMVRNGELARKKNA